MKSQLAIYINPPQSTNTSRILESAAKDSVANRCVTDRMHVMSECATSRRNLNQVPIDTRTRSAACETNRTLQDRALTLANQIVTDINIQPGLQHTRIAREVTVRRKEKLTLKGKACVLTNANRRPIVRTQFTVHLTS